MSFGCTGIHLPFYYVINQLFFMYFKPQINIDWNDYRKPVFMEDLRVIRFIILNHWILDCFIFRTSDDCQRQFYQRRGVCRNNIVRNTDWKSRYRLDSTLLTLTLGQDQSSHLVHRWALTWSNRIDFHGHLRQLADSSK